MLLRAGLFFFFLIVIAQCSQRESSDDPSPPKSPEEELTTFQVPSNLEMQLVAFEPMIQDPVAMTFDEDGRLWVVEMRGFMPDIDGNGETDPSGRVSVLEDTTGDGRMDKSTVYLDSLILPRALAVIPGGALVVDNWKLWITKDTNGDLKADIKELVDSTYAGTTLPEHSGNGLWRGIDNWYYNARSVLRYKLEEEKIIRDSTEFRGQWGISHDNDGRLYYNYNWSQLHADLVPPNYLKANKNHVPTSGIDHGLTLDRRIYPIRANPAVNRGYIPGTLDDQGRLLEFTAACSPYVYRGVTLPQEYYQNAFVCEPSGNLVKRNVVTEVGYSLKAKDPNPGHEFLASTDERFRPVALTSGPDGALYVADMYRGLVQHGEYVTPYLRDQTLKRHLDAPIHYGRIWRLVPSNYVDKPIEPLSRLTSHDLADKLSDENGWVRDMAQRLLVERKDTTVVSYIRQRMREGAVSPLGELHALWVMEGLHAVDRDYLVRQLTTDATFNSGTILRLLEPFARNDAKFRKKLGLALDTITHADPLQLVLSARCLDAADQFKIFKRALDALDTDEPMLFYDAMISGLSNRELAFAKFLIANNYDDVVLMEALATAIVKRRQPKEIADLLSMNNSGILNAVTVQGRGKWAPLKLASAPKITTTLSDPQKTIINNMFEWPGHKVDVEAVKASVKLTDDQQKLFAAGRQQYLSVCSGCHGTNGEGMQRMAPPLAGSEWVLGDERRLALLVLHGIEGPLEVAGKRYEAPDILPVMPSHSTMDDGNITSILVYIRNEWGNDAGGVNRRTVGRLRHTTQGRVMPWSAKELNDHMKEIDTVKTN
jgi:mono/diheme cytochrome c family protein/glucose/arabinose dehydrogenase